MGRLRNIFALYKDSYGLTNNLGMGSRFFNIKKIVGAMRDVDILNALRKRRIVKNLQYEMDLMW